MGYLGSQESDCGELFALSKLLLDIDHAFIKARFLKGDRRQFRKCRKDAHFLVGKAMRGAGVDVQCSDGLRAKNQRDAEQRDQSLMSCHLYMLITAGGLDIFYLERFLASNHDT